MWRSPTAGRATHRVAALAPDAGAEGGVVRSDAITRGLAALSKEWVEDTLLAEAGGFAPLIERFRDGRAEHNDESLAQTLGVDVGNVRAEVKPLLELGFLEQTGETFKVPMIYRGGLSITQGNAFAPDEDATNEDEQVQRGSLPTTRAEQLRRRRAKRRAYTDRAG